MEIDCKVRFAVCAQSGTWPVIQVWRTDEHGQGGWCWVRTPADMMDVSAEEWEAIANLAR